MKIEIRRATSSDSERATELARKAKAHWGYPAEWLASWRDGLAITADEIDKHPTFVASVEGEVVGVCQLREPDGRSVLEHVWVDPSVHGRGIGRALVEKAKSIAQGLIVIIADPSAEPFYMKLGARRVGQVPAPMPGAPARALPLLEMDA
ncbi:MAG TPA: GNAT family N-acetyltransferase [Thermoanaerobaculia bacterium]|jgi:ribosomal protein S18 acetylase RimI-like enzyme